MIKEKISKMSTLLFLSISFILVSAAFLLLDAVDLVPFSGTALIIYAITIVLIGSAIYLRERMI